MYNSKHFLVLVSRMTGCVWISASVSLLGIPIGIVIYAIDWKICTITAGIKKYKSKIKKRRKKHNTIVVLAKSKLNSTEVLISKDLNISQFKH